MSETTTITQFPEPADKYSSAYSHFLSRWSHKRIRTFKKTTGNAIVLYRYEDKTTGKTEYFAWVQVGKTTERLNLSELAKEEINEQETEDTPSGDRAIGMLEMIWSRPSSERKNAEAGQISGGFSMDLEKFIVQNCHMNLEQRKAKRKADLEQKKADEAQETKRREDELERQANRIIEIGRNISGPFFKCRRLRKQLKRELDASSQRYKQTLKGKVEAALNDPQIGSKKQKQIQRTLAVMKKLV